MSGNIHSATFQTRLSNDTYITSFKECSLHDEFCTLNIADATLIFRDTPAAELAAVLYEAIKNIKTSG